MTDTNTASRGLGLPGVLLVVFVVLKLAGVVAWPWIWVLAPFWIPLGIVLVLAVIVAIVVATSNKI